jgi:hypothetical protein
MKVKTHLKAGETGATITITIVPHVGDAALAAPAAMPAPAAVPAPAEAPALQPA